MAKQNNPKAFYSGCSGLVLPMPKYKFPKEFQTSSRLSYYSSLLNSIEINRSFYALPKGKTVAKWCNEVPEYFKFTFKLWKAITHAKRLQFQEADVRDFMNAINYAGNKKGCLLIQFPASIKNESLPQLQQLLHVIRANNVGTGWKVAIEFRDRSWYNSNTHDIVDHYDATIVVHDKSRAISPYIITSAMTVYLRFHGPGGDYRGAYSDSFLYEYATYIREWLTEGKSVFAYFNNTMGNAFDNVNTLNKYVRG